MHTAKTINFRLNNKVILDAFNITIGYTGRSSSSETYQKSKGPLQKSDS